ncbi:MAG: uracil-DNA glycosylase family protein [Syntrophales bacterium]
MQIHNSLDQIYSEAQQCQACPTIPPRKIYENFGVKFPVAYYSKEEGGINAKIVFIMESPGIAKGGAAQTGNLESGGNYDLTAKNGAALRKHAGISLRDFFVTNSILHAGMTNDGKMRKPKNSEIKTCSSFVKRIIDVINPPIVAAVGNAALKSLYFIEPHPCLKITECAGNHFKWYNRYAFPLCHWSPKGLISRSMKYQQEDFKKLRELIDQIKK